MNKQEFKASVAIYISLKAQISMLNAQLKKHLTESGKYVDSLKSRTFEDDDIKAQFVAVEREMITGKLEDFEKAYGRESLEKNEFIRKDKFEWFSLKEKKK